MEQPSPMMPKRTSKIQKTSYRGSLVNEHHLINQQKSSIDLMQNCDLPPPMKVFSGSDKAVMSSVMSSMNRVLYNGMSIGREEEGFEYYGVDYDGNNITSGGKNEKLELLKALRLSQTRAREAEERASGLTKERDFLSSAFLEDSLRLLAYRQWVKLLEVQVLKLKSEWQRQEQAFCCDCCEKEGGATGGCDGCIGGGGNDGVGVSWFVVIAVCLGIAGVGFAFGCRYSF